MGVKILSLLALVGHLVTVHAGFHAVVGGGYGRPSRTTTTTSSPTSNSAKQCSTTVIVTQIATVTAPISTITYEISSYTAEVDGSILGFVPAVLRRSTKYPGTTTVTASISTLTRITVPTLTVGVSSTITVPAPSGFLPIESTLPNATGPYYHPGSNPAGKRDLAKIPCQTITRTSLSTTTLPGPIATTVTTVSGLGIGFPEVSTTYDLVGFSNFAQTFTNDGGSYITVTTPRAITTYLATTETTVVLPTQYDAGRNISIYAACQTVNFAGRVVYDSGPFDSYLLKDTAQERVGGAFQRAYDCCAAAFELGGVGFWQWSPQSNSCFVHRVATSNDACVQSAQNFDVSHAGPVSPANEQQYGGRVTGNGVCGRVTRAVPYPEAGPGSGIA